MKIDLEEMCAVNKEAILAERLVGKEISEELRRQILPYADNKSLVVVSSEVAVLLTSRSEWGTSGGIGKYDQVTVFCRDESAMMEWQWRDRYSASNDAPWLAVNSIGKVKVFEERRGNAVVVVVEVELVNDRHDNRTITYTFHPHGINTTRVLSDEEQELFTAQVEEETARLMMELNKSWEGKPMMLASYPPGMTMPEGTPSQVPYRRPTIKQQEVRPDIGVAALVTEEQVDHRGSDPDMLLSLFLMTHEAALQFRGSDSSYDSEGGAFLTIIEVDAKRILLNTKHGKRSIVVR